MGQPKRKASPRVRELLATKTQFSSISKSKGEGHREWSDPGALLPFWVERSPPEPIPSPTQPPPHRLAQAGPLAWGARVLITFLC